METGGPGTGPAPATTNGTIWRIAADGTYEQVSLSGPGVVAPGPENNGLGSLPFLNAPSYPIGDFDEDGHYWVSARTSAGRPGPFGRIERIGRIEQSPEPRNHHSSAPQLTISH